MTPTATPPKHLFRYTVDGDPQETGEHELKVRQILTSAGLTPPEDYYLLEMKGKGGKDERHDSLDDVIKIHEGQAFVAVRRGPTPVS